MSIPSMAQVVSEQADYVKLSKIEVTVDTSMPCVEIQDLVDSELGFLLSGQEAEEFIQEASRLFEEAQDVSFSTACYAAAKPYVDCLG